jgi:hypothetical protein
MAEVFLLLLGAGVMLGVAVPNPRDVTLNWMRLGGIIALAMAGLAGYFVWRKGEWPMAHLGVVAALVLGELAFVQVAWRNVGRVCALGAFVAGVGVVVWNWPGGQSWAAWASSAGVAATSGLALMAMLLGHAYLTASKMTMRPFRRINGWLIAVLLVRLACAAGVTMWMQWHSPVMRLWPIHGFMVFTRWGVGLAVPLLFVVMAHECIGRRATQSATGILYVAGVLIFIGELLGLHLARETGLPF